MPEIPSQNSLLALSPAPLPAISTTGVAPAAVPMVLNAGTVSVTESDAWHTAPLEAARV
ncbi:hypothetical protein [Paeniglutamicibacter antarcticus]|uniref:Uncharacterized protein n=1 Tax=Paeniglutamicibacter antarcticus TaxID=494023 RepID=A0ABP9TMS8_9MICC